MSKPDPELRALLIGEFEKRVKELRSESLGTDGVQRILHTLKGAAALAGEAPLSAALARLERTAAADSCRIVQRATVLVDEALGAWKKGLPGLVDTWPKPPADIGVPSINPTLQRRYVLEMRDRIAALSLILTNTADAVQDHQQAMRHLHTMKSAAATVGDDLMAWFCHGLEEALRLPEIRPDLARDRLMKLMRWRAVLSELLDDPSCALQTLTSLSQEPQTVGFGMPLPNGPPPKAPVASQTLDEEALLRVPVASIERVLERLMRLASVDADMVRRAETIRAAARNLRSVRASLVEARRLIGPPRPWGASAAALARIESSCADLGSLSKAIEKVADQARFSARNSQRHVATSRAELGAIQQATAAFVLDPVRKSIERLAQHEGCPIRVDQRGSATPMDRRLTEVLFDPVLQLARNALAHGIESAEQRAARGKPAVGLISISAEIQGADLLIGVEDDGAGIDFAAIRAQAVRANYMTEAQAQSATDDALLQLVFAPGLTTKPSADLLAGRGLGLDLALRAVRRLGGTIQLSNRPRQGLRATIEVPLEERGLVNVLWVTSMGHTFAFFARRVLSVGPSAQVASAVAHLANLLLAHSETTNSGAFVLTLEGRGSSGSVMVTVDTVGHVEQVPVRPVPLLVAAAGPYVGVIIGRDGRPSLLVDAHALADSLRGMTSSEGLDGRV